MQVQLRSLDFGPYIEHISSATFVLKARLCYRNTFGIHKVDSQHVILFPSQNVMGKNIAKYTT